MQALVRKIDVDEHKNKEDMITKRSYRCCLYLDVLKVIIVRDALSFSMIHLYEQTGHLTLFFVYSDLIDLS